MNTGSAENPASILVRQATLASYYGLILFFGFVSLLALDPVRFSSLIIWILQILPLLPFAPGLHRNNQRVILWLSLLVLLYFIHGVQVAFDPNRFLQGIIEAVLCVILFTCLVTSFRLARKTQSD